MLSTTPPLESTQHSNATPSPLVLSLLAQYPPLPTVTRTHVDTNAAAYYLDRRPQTLRGWHCHGDFPTPGLRPIAINGRLAWNVAAIKSVMGVA